MNSRITHLNYIVIQEIYYNIIYLTYHRNNTSYINTTNDNKLLILTKFYLYLTKVGITQVTNLYVYLNYKLSHEQIKYYCTVYYFKKYGK